MPHTCEDCGETFDTLSRLRLHDCPEDEVTAERERRKQNEEIDASIRRMTREEDTAAKRNASDELTDALERARDGDHTAV